MIADPAPPVQTFRQPQGGALNQPLIHSYCSSHIPHSSLSQFPSSTFFLSVVPGFVSFCFHSLLIGICQKKNCSKKKSPLDFEVFCSLRVDSLALS